MSPRTSAEILLNADAGGKVEKRIEEEVLDRFAACQILAHVVPLEKGTDVETAVRGAIALRPNVLVAGGGDGTLSTVAGILAGSDIPFGILPLGTLNHFAKDLGIPLDLAGAIRTVCDGRMIRVDVGRVNGRVFINNSSLGLYPQIVQQREDLRQRLGRGKWPSFLWALFLALRRYPFIDLRIKLDGEMLMRRTPLLFVGNNSYDLKSLTFGERKRIDAGRLSVHIINRTDRAGLVALAARAVMGRLAQSRDFESLSATHIEVNTRRGRITVATDGELKRLTTPLLYETDPLALAVIVPEETAGRET